ncbi:MAG: RHS repeat protein, partial [Gemmatimonadales bacterium]|nr:RHS repeat protein [Gemmatimonadales bacterium]
TQRSVSLAEPDNPLSLTTLTDVVSINGRTFTSIYDAASRTFTDTTPGGRQEVTNIDAQSRVVQEQVPGLAPISNTYDARGR